MKKLTFSVLVLLFLSGAATATESNTTPALPQTSTTQSGANHYISPDKELIQDFCPPVTSLVRNPEKQTWAAPNSWKTNSPSFLRTVDAFVGAQWVGVGIGEIICVYTKVSRNSFPVTLQRGRLGPAPAVGGFWSADKGGYMECKSNDVKNCPFFIQVLKPSKNVYEELDFYKGKPTEED